MRHYLFSLVFTAVCLALAVWYGWTSTNSLVATLNLLWIVVVLSVLEVSLSFDNAVVNASVLKDMDAVWQRRFLTWGMAFAVFGMRIVFPLAIVAIAASLSPIDAITLSLNDPARYQDLVNGAHVGISGFGGSFLAMVGLKFFFDAEKDVHWVRILESGLARFAALPAAEIAILLLAMAVISSTLDTDVQATFLISGMFGLVAFIGVEGVSSLLERETGVAGMTGAVARSGLGGFLYLNILDASFSFDGVIVRRQNIWHNSRRRFTERGPRLGLIFRRRACGVASADIRVSFA